MLFMPGWTELILIFLAVLLLFGAKRIPEIAQGLGRGIRDFKSSLRETKDEIEKLDQPEKNDDSKKQESGGDTR